MAVFRLKKKTGNFTILDNTGPQDPRLSWKAKGILVYMLTMPDNWTFHREELVNHASDGISALRSGLKELKKFGYLKRVKVKDEGNGQITWETEVYEVPVAENQPVENQTDDDEDDPVDENQPVDGKSASGGFSTSGKPAEQEIRSAENRTLQRTDPPRTDVLNNIPFRAGKLPDIQMPTALLFISLTGIPDISEDDEICLRLLDKLHTPAAIQKELIKALDRLERNGSVKLEQPDGEIVEIKSKQELPIRYLYNSMKNYTTGGRGGNAKHGTGSANHSRDHKDYSKGSEHKFA